jgi:hypothetical protein
MQRLLPMSAHARRFSKKKASKVTLKHHQKVKEMAEESDLFVKGDLGGTPVRSTDIKFHR